MFFPFFLMSVCNLPQSPFGRRHTIHNYSLSSSAAPPCLHWHSNNNSIVCMTYPSYFSMSKAVNRAKPGMEVIMANNELKSVNITDILISERTMSLLIMELFICLWCAVNNTTTRAQNNAAPMCHRDTPRATKTVTKVTFKWQFLIYLTYIWFRLTFCSKTGAKSTVH